MLISILILFSLSPIVFLTVFLRTYFSPDELAAMGISLEKQLPAEG